MNYQKIWEDTGTINRGIVIFLVLMSIASLSVAIWKWLIFRRMARATKQFAPAFSSALEATTSPRRWPLAEQYHKSHVARVLGESLREVAPLLDDPRAAGAAITSAASARSSASRSCWPTSSSRASACWRPSAPPLRSWGCSAPRWAS